MSEVTDLTGRTAALLSVVEVGLGSILHGFSVPFGGHFLSLNQAFVLSRATLKARGQRGARAMPAQASAIAGALKSLSPAGKKLTPMLAISAQGLLYSIGTLVGGTGFLGALLGSVLLSLWAFAQPVLVYYVLYGRTMTKVVEYLYEKTRESMAFEPSALLWVVGAVLGVKLVLAAGAAILAWKLPEKRAEAFQEKLMAAARAKPKSSATPARGAISLALRDLFNPLFVVSLALTAMFYFFVEASSAELVWALIRPVAVGFILFFAARSLPWARVLSMLERRGHTGFAEAFRVATHALRRLG